MDGRKNKSNDVLFIVWPLEHRTHGKTIRISKNAGLLTHAGFYRVLPSSFFDVSTMDEQWSEMCFIFRFAVSVNKLSNFSIIELSTCYSGVHYALHHSITYSKP